MQYAARGRSAVARICKGSTASCTQVGSRARSRKDEAGAFMEKARFRRCNDLHFPRTKGGGGLGFNGSDSWNNLSVEASWSLRCQKASGNGG